MYAIGYTNFPIVKHKYKVMLIRERDLGNEAEFFMFDKEERDQLIERLIEEYNVERKIEFIY